jgi:hypothetical protein
VAAAPEVDVSHVRGVRRAVERPVDQLERVPVVDIGGAAAPEAYVVDVLRPAEELEELDRLRRPAGDVVGELLDHRRRALAPPVGDRVGDEPALGDPAAAHVE